MFWKKRIETKVKNYSIDIRFIDDTWIKGACTEEVKLKFIKMLRHREVFGGCFLEGPEGGNVQLINLATVKWIKFTEEK